MGIAAPRILIAGTASGSGKTTLTCGLLRLLTRRGLRVQACKCGPDFIDPAFHQHVLGVPSRNLDLFLGGEELVRSLVADGAADVDVTVIEGVMGLYDGIATSADASSWDVARVTQTPVVLVVDARGRALSVVAEVAGFAAFMEPSQVAGVVLNRVSASYYPMLRDAVQQRTGVPVLGYLPQLEQAHLQSRHLGLVDAREVDDLQARVDGVADALERSLDVEALLRVAQGAPVLDAAPLFASEKPVSDGSATFSAGLETNALAKTVAPVIAVARDAAFTFYYEDTLRLLQHLGARLAYFSPLEDKTLPEGACGLLLGGGYPELHAQQLSANGALRQAVEAAIQDDMPTIAECGGFLYLHRTLEDEQGTPWPMVGAIDAAAYRLGKLGRFGYVTLTACVDGLLADAGQCLPAHEFHYWESERPGDAYAAHKPQSTRGWDCAVSTETLYAGFPHLYLPGSPQAARRFVEACMAYGRREGRLA